MATAQSPSQTPPQTTPPTPSPDPAPTQTRPAQRENVVLEEFWAKVSAAEKKDPTFAGTIFKYHLSGHQPRLTGLYVCHNKLEYCYLFAQEVLVEKAETLCGTNHVKALQIMIDELGLRKTRKLKFDYIAGFYYDAGEKKVTSAYVFYIKVVSPINVSPVQYTPADQIEEWTKDFETRIVPKIEKKLQTDIAQCQGITKKKKCNLLLRGFGGLFCKHHQR